MVCWSSIALQAKQIFVINLRILCILIYVVFLSWSEGWHRNRRCFFMFNMRKGSYKLSNDQIGDKKSQEEIALRAFRDEDKFRAYPGLS